MIPLLTKQLQWRVQRFDDSVVNINGLRGLRVHVVGQEVAEAKSKSEFPLFGELVAFDDVTRGKAGGV